MRIHSACKTESSVTIHLVSVREIIFPGDVRMRWDGAI